MFFYSETALCLERCRNVSKVIQTRINGFTLRFAEEKDTSTIFQMIKELAEYEKLLDRLRKKGLIVDS